MELPPRAEMCQEQPGAPLRELHHQPTQAAGCSEQWSGPVGGWEEPHAGCPWGFQEEVSGIWTIWTKDGHRAGSQCSSQAQMGAPARIRVECWFQFPAWRQGQGSDMYGRVKPLQVLRNKETWDWAQPVPNPACEHGWVDPKKGNPWFCKQCPGPATSRMLLPLRSSAVTLKHFQQRTTAKVQIFRPHTQFEKVKGIWRNQSLKGLKDGAEWRTWGWKQGARLLAGAREVITGDNWAAGSNQLWVQG